MVELPICNLTVIFKNSNDLSVICQLILKDKGSGKKVVKKKKENNFLLRTRGDDT